MNQEQGTSGRWGECVENGETEVQGGWNAVRAESARHGECRGWGMHSPMSAPRSTIPCWISKTKPVPLPLDA